jgi:hypothetical protein
VRIREEEPPQEPQALLGSNGYTQDHTQQRRTGQARDRFALEEARFAGWFWRSDKERKQSNIAGLYILTLVFNFLVTVVIIQTFGLVAGIAFAVSFQVLVTLLAVPQARHWLAHSIWSVVRRGPTGPGTAHQVYPLADVSFYMNRKKDVLLLAHKDGVTATALLVVDKLPVGIKGNMHAFIRAIYSAGIPLFYTLIHAPKSELDILRMPAISDRAQTALAEQDASQVAAMAHRHGGVWKTRLLLGTRRNGPNMASLDSQGELEFLVNQDLQTLQNSFRTAYPHVRLQRLTGQKLEDAARSTMLVGSAPHFF